MTVGQSGHHGLSFQRTGSVSSRQQAERPSHEHSGDTPATADHGVPDGVPDDPANTFRRSASVTVAALAVFDPSFVRYASAVISSPGFRDRLL